MPLSSVWEIIEEVELLRDSRISVSKQTVRLPDGREIHDYLHVETRPTSIVFAMTDEGEVLCERQYKHGVGRTILTLVGGGIEYNESPEEAAKRELLEETGYASGEWQLLAKTVTHANAGGTTFYSFLARNCRKVREPHSEDLEIMEVELLQLREVIVSFTGGESPLAGDATTLLHAIIALGLFRDPYS